MSRPGGKRDYSAGHAYHLLAAPIGKYKMIPPMQCLWQFFGISMFFGHLYIIFTVSQLRKTAKLRASTIPNLN